MYTVDAKKVLYMFHFVSVFVILCKEEEMEMEWNETKLNGGYVQRQGI